MHAVAPTEEHKFEFAFQALLADYDWGGGDLRDTESLIRFERLSGFVDLGPAGDGQQYFDTVFVYQSQSGYVAKTKQQDTKAASVQGTFSFLPGSIQKPTGPMFHVTIAPFPLTVPYPFYWKR